METSAQTFAGEFRHKLEIHDQKLHSASTSLAMKQLSEGQLSPQRKQEVCDSSRNDLTDWSRLENLVARCIFKTDTDET